ncbi:MAG: DUF3857 domain-containing protein [Saprospiraceae bacterium]
MKFKTIIFSSLLTLLYYSPQSLFAQNAPDKFGKIDKKDLEMTTYEQDPGAHAVKLFDVAYIDFRYLNGFNVNTQRHFRIKILDVEGLEYADVEIPYLRTPGRKESVAMLRAFVYTLENGEVVKTKLENKDVFDEQVDKNNFKKKFALPNVKVGSVIEVKYELLSEFWYQIDPWLFQEDIPAKRSEILVSIPEYFIFNTNFKGYDFGTLSINDKSTSTGNLALGAGQTINCQYTTYHWAAENVPAFTAEPYITTARNYLGRVEFELARTNFPNSFNESYNTSWEAIAEQLATSEDFGVGNANFLNDQGANLIAGEADPGKQVAILFEATKKMVKWDNKYRRFAGVGDLKKALKEGIGNSAEVNFILLGLLKSAGLEAFPVLVSTRSNGYLNPYQPSLDQFNHTIAAVKVGDGFITLDATDPFVPASYSPINCLNDKGFILMGNRHQWISLEAREKYKLAVQAQLAIGEDGSLSGTIKEAKDGYAAYLFRKAYFKEGDADKYVKSIQDKVDGMTIEEHSFENQENLYKRVEANYKVNITDKTVMAGDMIYISPMLHYALEENPFKLAERKYPVDYAYPMEEIYSIAITFPEGYALEELPEGTNLALPENAGKFTYSAKQLDHSILLTIRFKIENPFISFEQYPFLKEFYSLMVAKYAEQIVLKKKT